MKARPAQDAGSSPEPVRDGTIKTPPDLAAIVRVFAEVPVLASAGVLAGATALHHEHLENRLGRFGMRFGQAGAW